MFLFNGCVESVALLGGSSSGKLVQSSLNSAVSYGVKKQTGKTPLGHALSYAHEKKPAKNKEPCSSFVVKTNSEFCLVLKKKIVLTKAKIKIQKLSGKPRGEFTSSLQPSIDKKSKIKYLD